MIDQDAVSAESAELKANAQEGGEGYTDAEFLASLQAMANGTAKQADAKVESEDDLVVALGDNEDHDLDESKVTAAKPVQKVAEVKPGSDIRPAEETKAQEQEKPEEAARKRVYTGHLDPVQSEVMRLVAEYPGTTFADAEVMARRLLGEAEPVADDGTVAYDDLDPAQKLEVDEADLKEVEDQIIEKDRIGLRDEEWEDLTRKRNGLHTSIAINRHEATQEQVKSNDWQRDFEAAEAQVIQEFPDINNVKSELYYLVSARTQQLVELSKTGEAPDWYNPTDPAALRRIAVEAQERLTGVKKESVLEAKPSTNDAEQRSQVTKIGGVPSSASLSQVVNRTAPGITQEQGVNLDPDASDADFLSSLSNIIGGNKSKDAGRQSTARPSRFQLV